MNHAAHHLSTLSSVFEGCLTRHTNPHNKKHMQRTEDPAAYELLPKPVVCGQGNCFSRKDLALRSLCHPASENPEKHASQIAFENNIEQRGGRNTVHPKWMKHRGCLKPLFPSSAPGRGRVDAHPPKPASMPARPIAAINSIAGMAGDGVEGEERWPGRAGNEIRASESKIIGIPGWR